MLFLTHSPCCKKPVWCENMHSHAHTFFFFFFGHMLQGNNSWCGEKNEGTAEASGNSLLVVSHNISCLPLTLFTHTQSKYTLWPNNSIDISWPAQHVVTYNHRSPEWDFITRLWFSIQIVRDKIRLGRYESALMWITYYWFAEMFDASQHCWHLVETGESQSIHKFCKGFLLWLMLWNYQPVVVAMLIRVGHVCFVCVWVWKAL